MVRTVVDLEFVPCFMLGLRTLWKILAMSPVNTLWSIFKAHDLILSYALVLRLHTWNVIIHTSQFLST